MPPTGCNSGFPYFDKTLTINLAPANIRKEGAGFDLPVAMGILGAMGVVTALDRHIVVGELSLDGAIRPVRGALSVAVCARDRGIANLILPAENAAEAAVVKGVNVYGVRYLAGVVALLTRPEEFRPVARNGNTRSRPLSQIAPPLRLGLPCGSNSGCQTTTPHIRSTSSLPAAGMILCARYSDAYGPR